jgi:hypothetical protein
MPIYFDQVELGQGRAVWRSEDGTEEAVLCSVSQIAFENEATVRDRFAELINAVAAHHQRKHAAAPAAPVSRLAGIPCETCTAPEADDVRHRAGQVSDISELQLSAGGFPVGCCRRRIVAVMGIPDTPPAASMPAAARRMGRRY